MPIKDGYYKQLKPSSGSTHYTLVDESVCNGTTDYVATSTVGLRDSYVINATSVGLGAFITQIAVKPCESRATTGTGTATTDVFYRYNGADSANLGSYALSATTIPADLATTTFSSLNLFTTSTTALEIGAVYSAGTRGMRLSRIATVLTYTLAIPSAPSYLAVNNVSSTENDLTWTDNSNNEVGFRVYRSMNGGAYTVVATTTPNAVFYNDTGLTAGQTYTYKVAAFNSAGEAFTSIVYSTITAPATIRPIFNIKGKLKEPVIVDQLQSGHDFSLQPGSTYIFAARYFQEKDWYLITSVLFQYDSRLLTDDSTLSDVQLMDLIVKNQRAKELELAYPNEVYLGGDIKHHTTYNSYASRHYDASGNLIDDTVVLHQQYLAAHPEAAAQSAQPNESVIPAANESAPAVSEQPTSTPEALSVPTPTAEESIAPTETPIPADVTPTPIPTEEPTPIPTDTPVQS